MPAKSKTEILAEKAQRKIDRIKQSAEKKLAKLRASTTAQTLKAKARLVKAKAKPDSTNQLKKDLWTITSKLVRIQSSNCYTCGTYIPEFTDRSAGHYWTKGGHQATRFDLDNLRVQCDPCNRFKSGNLAEYSWKLRKEIGDQRYEQLYTKAHTTKTSWNKDWLRSEIAERTELFKKISSQSQF